jgi:DNA-binding LytR/AlgR family response regulator
MKKRCLVVDDEPLAINVIQKFLTNFEHYEVVGTCSSAVEAMEMLSKTEVDVLFLDINMPLLNGIDFVKSLDKPPLVVMTTAYREYAVESFEQNVLDYLVKPIGFQRFVKTIHKIDQRMAVPVSVAKPAQAGEAIEAVNPPSDEFVFFKVDKKMIKVFLDDIIYIESLKDYVRVKTDIQSLVTHNNLVGISEILPESQFIRIHRSYIISIKRVKAIDGNCIEIGDKSLPIGRNYQKDVKSFLLNSD